jgi:hypothetical protein
MDNCKNCNHTLTDEQLEALVEKVIEKMTERAYRQVGQKVVHGAGWFFSIVGVVTLALYSILKTKGIIE